MSDMPSQHPVAGLCHNVFSIVCSVSGAVRKSVRESQRGRIPLVISLLLLFPSFHYHYFYLLHLDSTTKKLRLDPPYLRQTCIQVRRRQKRWLSLLFIISLGNSKRLLGLESRYLRGLFQSIAHWVACPSVIQINLHFNSARNKKFQGQISGNSPRLQIGN